MSVKIKADKSKIVLNKTETFLSNLQSKITDLTSVIGTLASLFPAMTSGKLYHRNLEKTKMLAVKDKKGN